MRRAMRRFAVCGTLVATLGILDTAASGALASTVVHGAVQEAGIGAVPAGCDHPQPPGHVQCYLSSESVVSPALVPATTTCTVDEAAGYTPCNIQNAYGLAAAIAKDGAGSVVAVVDPNDDPKAASDLAVFRSHFKLPACTTASKCFTKYNQTGQNQELPVAECQLRQRDGARSRHGLHRVSAVSHLAGRGQQQRAPEASFTAIHEATVLGTKVVSDSWGSGEQNLEASQDTSLDVPGVAITFSSGDGAYQGGVQYPRPPTT